MSAYRPGLLAVNAEQLRRLQLLEAHEHVLALLRSHYDPIVEGTDDLLVESPSYRLVEGQKDLRLELIRTADYAVQLTADLRRARSQLLANLASATQRSDISRQSGNYWYGGILGSGALAAFLTESRFGLGFITAGLTVTRVAQRVVVRKQLGAATSALEDGETAIQSLISSDRRVKAARARSADLRQAAREVSVARYQIALALFRDQRVQIESILGPLPETKGCRARWSRAACQVAKLAHADLPKLDKVKLAEQIGVYQLEREMVPGEGLRGYLPPAQYHRAFPDANMHLSALSDGTGIA